MSIQTEKMTPDQVRILGLEALSRELGPTGMIRFLQFFETGRGDYSKERHSRLAGATVDDVAEEIWSKRKE